MFRSVSGVVQGFLWVRNKAPKMFLHLEALALMKPQSTSSSFSGLDRQHPEFHLVRSKGINPVMLLQLRIESCEDRREQQSQSFFFFTILKYII